MPWPIPVFSEIERPTPISLRVWLPMLAAIASGAVGAVLLLWPHGKPTNTFQFWGALVGAPLVGCALVFGLRLNRWEGEQTFAEESEKELDRLGAMWRNWTRRHLCVVDVAAFPAATDEIARFAEVNIDLPTNTDRNIAFGWAKGHAAAFRRTRLIHLVARRFGDALRTRRELVVTLMLDDTSLTQAEAWTQRVRRIFGRMLPGVMLHVEVQSATGGVRWITHLVDRIDPTTRLVIAAQLWTSEYDDQTFSEGAAAFLIDPGEAKAGSIFRPMTSTRDTLETGLAQIGQIQMSPDRLKHVWVTGCEDDESSIIPAALTPDPRDGAVDRLLDGLLGNPGPASGWVALAIAMEAMRGAGPQLVTWREPGSESLYLCTISPMPQKEATV
jgi:hypothetical protein